MVVFPQLQLSAGCEVEQALYRLHILDVIAVHLRAQLQE